METILMYLCYFLITVCWVGFCVGIPFLLLAFIWLYVVAPVISLFSKKKRGGKHGTVKIDGSVWYASYRNHNS